MSLAILLAKAIDFYSFLVIIWVVTSWVPQTRENRIIRAIGSITEPFLSLFRFIPPVGGFDISPMVAIIVLMMLDRMIVG